MSIEKRDTRLDGIERSNKLYTLSLREDDHVIAIKDDLNTAGDKIKTAQERYIQYAKDLAQRIDLKDETLAVKEYKHILRYIVKKLIEAGLDENKAHYAYEALKNYPEFKDPKYNKLTKRGGSDILPLENLNDEDSIDRTLDRAFEILKNTNLETLPSEKLDQLAEFRSLARTKRLQQIAYKTQYQYELDKLLHTISETEEILSDWFYDFMRHWKEIEDLIGPDKMKMFTKQLTESCKHMRIYNKIYASLSSEKYSYDLITWFKIYHDVKEHGYGYARNKYKIEILDKDGNKTGEYWKVTTKDIKKMMRHIEEEQLITRFIEASKYFEKRAKSAMSKDDYEKTKDMPRLMDILVDWRDKNSTMNNRIAERRKNTSPILSDAASWRCNV